MSSDTSFPHREPPSDSVPLLTSFTLTSGFRLLFCEASRCPLSSTPAMWILVPRCACNLFIYLYLRSQTISYFIQSVSNLLQSLFTLTLKLPSLANGIPFKLVLWSFRSPSFCEHFLFSHTCRPSCTLPGTALKSAIFRRSLAHLGGTQHVPCLQKLGAPHYSWGSQVQF